ncbi:response regulator transcription factor [Acidobacteriota bacterium]
MKKILIIEDDEAILLGFKDDLEFEGYAVTCAENGNDGLQQALKNDFDLIILDILLPEMNGFEVCRKIRAAGKSVPILMLTAARTEEMDKVRGLELGADDYLTKPVGTREMAARVKALLRRAKNNRETSDTFQFGDNQVDFKSHRVMQSGKEIHLTALEFELLTYFIRHRGGVITRDELLDEAWGDAIVSPRSIDPHIVHLRQKLEKDPASPRFFSSIRGVGYRFDG